MKKAHIVVALALVITTLLTACSREQPRYNEDSGFGGLNGLEVTEAQSFDNGLFTISYDGNVLIPASYSGDDTCPEMQVNFVSTNMMRTEDYGYGYINYMPTQRYPDMDKAIAFYESYFGNEADTFTTKVGHGAQNSDRAAFIYSWMEGEDTVYGLLCCENVNEVSCKFAYFVSSVEEIIVKYATLISDSFALTEDGYYDDALAQASMERTKELYAQFYPELEEDEKNPNSETALESEEDKKTLFFDGPYEIYVGAQFILQPSGTAAGDPMTYESEDPSIVTVTNEGLVTGVSVGEVIINAYTEYGLSTSLVVNVIE